MHRFHLSVAFVAGGLALGSAGVTAQVAPPPMAKECGDETVAGHPLPNSAAALQQRKRLKILAIGSSPKAVLGLGRGGRPLLEHILERTIKGLDVEIVNRGFSGELAEAAGDRIRIEVALSQPDIVLWQVGTNDALAHVPVDAFEQAVTATVQWLKRHNVDVILVGLRYAKSLAKDPHYRAIRASLGRIAAAEKVLRIGRYQAMEVLAQTAASVDEPVLGDFAQTETGYNCMAQYLARTITVGLFARPPKKALPEPGR